jgi:glycosyltransferase involved in cell wall biosynthesis
MRILQVTDFFHPFEVGGAEISVRTLSRLLTQWGVEVEVLSGYPGSRELPPSDQPFPVHYVPYREPRNPILATWEQSYFAPARMAERLKELLRNGRFDLLHAHNQVSAVAVLMAKRAGASLPPSILTAHSYCHVCPLGHALRMRSDGTLHCGLRTVTRCIWEDGPVKGRKVAGILPLALTTRALHVLSREAVSCFDRYICISTAVRRSMEATLGVDAEVVYTLPEFLELQTLAHGMEIGEDHPSGQTVLYVGRLVKEKGLPNLLEAFRRVAAEEEGVRLVIVGGGALMGGLQAWVDGHGLRGRVTFTGPVPHGEVGRYFDDAAIVVVPSRWPEPLGMVVLEALYAGKPVVATGHGGIVDIIEDGVNGILVPPEDPAALSGAILQLLRDPPLRARLQRSGPSTVADRFDPATLARRTLEIYQGMVGKAAEGWEMGRKGVTVGLS